MLLEMGVGNRAIISRQQECSIGAYNCEVQVLVPVGKKRCDTIREELVVSGSTKDTSIQI